MIERRPDIPCHLRSLAVILYSCLMTLLSPLLRLVSYFNPKIASQLVGRREDKHAILEIAKLRSVRQRAVLFFCSSAGEFEQARPLIDRISADRDAMVHIVFFSRSGLEFARARGETLSMSLAPDVDSVWRWGRLFSALRPDTVLVVRHELWPAFLETARNYAALYLIDASMSIGESTSRIKRALRSVLLSFFDKIFVVDAADAEFFAQNYHVPSGRMAVVGDTKYDRVIERARASSGSLENLRAALGDKAGLRRIVLGSAYREDVQIWIEAHKHLGDAARRWQTVIAPHHPESDFIAWIMSEARRSGLIPELLSERAAATTRGHADVIVVDRIGVLAEIYGTAELAFVGGAMHRQVHNVLEPACRALALAFGPFYKNSPEATQLVNAKLAEVCADGPQMAAWWRRNENRDATYQAKLDAAIQGFCGATDRILATWAANAR